MPETSRHPGIGAVLAVIATVSCAIAARAAEVELRGGPRLQVPIAIEGDSVSLQVGRREFRLPRSEVRVIEQGGLPRDEWPDRCEKALHATPRAQFAAAWWALENGLTAEAEAMFRVSHDNDPSLAIASRVVRVSEQLSAPTPRPDLDSLRSALGVPLEILEGDHVVLLHRLSEGEASERIDLMERVLRTFYLSFEGWGFDLRLPRQKQISVCFPTEAQYTSYLQSVDAGELAATRGYYHPTLQIVLTYDGGHDRSARTVSQELSNECDRLRVELGTVAHELIHQLVTESGLAPRGESFPLWLHEGLAMQFETVRDGRWTGFAPINDTRLAHWRARRSLPRLGPLLHDPGFSHGYDADHYAQSWAFVSFLRIRHPTAFIALLDTARLPESVELPVLADRLTESILESISTDLPALELSWRSYVRTLQVRAVSASSMNP